jgi:ComF family protein
MNLLDIVFPKGCIICKRKGEYLCERCKKLFKKELPECYMCRRISNGYRTHRECRGMYSMDSVFVAWEYSSLTSDLLKKYKYGYAYDMSEVLCKFFIDSIRSSSYWRMLKNTLIINMPISSSRLRERGFNQTYNLAKSISMEFNLDFSDSLVGKSGGSEHQALKDKDERREITTDSFYIVKEMDISKYKSITIIDDVITTGSTLDAIAKRIKSHYGNDTSINAMCMFRGKPVYYSEVSSC